MKITKLAILALAAVFCTNGLALAKVDNTHTRVSAVVVPSCSTFSAGDINFGRIDVLNGGSNIAKNAHLSYTCTNGTTLTLSARGSCITNDDTFYNNFSMCDQTTSGYTLDYWLGYSSTSADAHCYDYQSPENANVLYPADANSVSVSPGTGAKVQGFICASLDPRNNSGTFNTTYADNAPQHYVDHVTLTLTY